MNTIVYQHDALPYQIHFSTSAWRLMRNHAQHWWWHKESGGQMFGVVNGFRIEVKETTPPRKADARTRTSFEIDTRAATSEISERQVRGLLYLGDWHTHPETKAKPSQQDLINAAKLMRGAPDNPFILIVIVGTDDTFVAAYNGRKMLRLNRSRAH